MRIGAGVGLLLLLAPAASLAAPQGTAFTYQGRLTDGGGRATGTYDFRFILYTASAGGSQVGPAIVEEDVAVTEGRFAVPLDFGAVFDGSPRFLEVAVRPGAGTGAFAVLSPRQEVAVVPSALFSATTGDADLQRRSVPPTCLPGQYLRALAPDGTPTCAADADANSGGTVTSVTAGAGLSGGTITLSGPIGVSFAGTGSASTVARSDHGHGTAYQARINACAPGASIRQVNGDGTVECTASGVAPGATLTTLDSAGNVGVYSSVTIGNDGLGLITYYDSTNGSLKVAHCANLACTAATSGVRDTPGGLFTWVTIGTDGFGLISYWASSLKVAHCTNTACTAVDRATLDSAGAVGAHASVTIGTDGLGLVSYHDLTNQDLKVAHCDDTTCTTAQLVTLDSAGTVGNDTTIAIGTDGLGLIAYGDLTNGDLKVAHCATTDCSSLTSTTAVDGPSDVSYYASMAIGADGLGLISYWDATNDDLKVAHCTNTACTGATANTLDGTGNVGRYTSLRIGADGLGLISYYDETNGDLKVAHCRDLACTSATLSRVDSAGNIGQYTALAIGADGLGLISYYDVTNGDLKVAHCRNLLCSAFVARSR